MTSKAIEVARISKKFSLNSDKNRRYALLDLFKESLGINRLNALRKGEFWAVNDVSFDVMKGESLALVGRNGCGKSTTLKIIAGLLNPDHGNINISGRIQAMISLGAGFNHALSGKENIYNSAAVLGLTRKETLKIMDEIIEFSELDDFIDSPVSTYSSGMKARLGFSISINLKPDILIVDEILSVGDHAFQNKCNEKFIELKKKNVTILLVSHSSSKVIQLCDRAVWLEKGQIMDAGDSSPVVKNYLEYTERLQFHKSKSPRLKSNDSIYGPIYPKSEILKDLYFQIETDKEIKPLSPLKIHYGFKSTRKINNLNVTLNIVTKDSRMVTAITTLNEVDLFAEDETEFNFCLDIPNLPLNPGNYVITMPIHEGHSYLFRDVVANLTVLSNNNLSWGMCAFPHSLTTTKFTPNKNSFIQHDHE